MELTLDLNTAKWAELRAFVAAGAYLADDEDVARVVDERSDELTGLVIYVIDEQVTPPPAWWIERWRRHADADQVGTSDVIAEPTERDLLDVVTETAQEITELRQSLKDGTE